MKKVFVAIAFTVIAFVGQAQCVEQEEADYNGNEAECSPAFSIFNEFLKQKNLKEAATAWWKVQEICPKYKTSYYSNGKYIYKQMAQAITDKNSEEFKNKMDSLEIMYDLWTKNYGDCYELQMKRAHDLMLDETHRYNKAFKYFQMAFDAAPDEAIQSYDAVYYFRAAYFMVGAKLIDCGQMMEIYQKLDGISKKKIEENEAAGNSGEVQKWKTTQQTLESYIVPCASCDILIPIYKKKTDAAPEDIDLAEEVLGKLDKLECDDPYLLELAILIDAARPTAKSKISIGNAYYGMKEYKKALTYYNEAIAFEDISEESKNMAIERMAKVYLGQGSYKNAFKYAGMLSGCEAKFIQAQAVAGTAGSCATNMTDRTAVYSYALDLADAAGSCASSSWKSKLVSQLSTQQELFIEGLKEGDSKEVPCWGNSVKLRIKK